MSIFTHLKQLHLDVPLLIAGLAGGIAFLPKNAASSWSQKFCTVLSGALTANYLAPVVTRWLNFADDLQFGFAFILGYGGLKSVELIWNYVAHKFKTDEK